MNTTADPRRAVVQQLEGLVEGDAEGELERRGGEEIDEVEEEEE